MSVNQKEKIPEYNKRVCFIRRSITNIITLKKITEQYIATYDINYQMSIVNREGSFLSNMGFLIHDSGLHYCEPPRTDLVFLNTVSKNK